MNTVFDQKSIFDSRFRVNGENESPPSSEGDSRNSADRDDNEDDDEDDNQLNTDRLRRFKIQPIQKLQQQIKLNATLRRNDQLSCNKTFN